MGVVETARNPESRTGEVVDHRVARRRIVDQDESFFDLPIDATVVNDSTIAQSLALIRELEIELYLRTSCTVPKSIGFEGRDVEWSSYDSPTFNNQLSPTAFGVNWYRGIAVNVTPTVVDEDIFKPGSQVILLQPWMQPWREGGAPDPVVLIRGGATVEEAIEVVKNYSFRLAVGVRETMRRHAEARDWVDNRLIRLTA